MTHSNENEVRLYRAKMDLEQLKIHAQLLKTIRNFGPAHGAVESLSPGHDRLAWSSKLSFLDVVPSGPESKSRAPTQPFILAGFSYIADDFQAGGEQSTTICRLEIHTNKPGLHASFDSLSAKKAAPRGELSVRKIRQALWLS